ncbi:MAG: DNA mismatch endonuclease Vsr [Cohaesibacteraceae bacterium]|nr:DNA mismatch endonuclease Vsr [Cohaesibacteraceae bacterium]MBL4875913.1 DNA mismatch endonuclease Vsr [Cohaesibacteraceae bacterium]
MADVVSPQKRSQMMAGIKGKNTKPEMMIRTALHRRGFRYRIHNKDLPGKPDLVFAKYRAVVFVHGCFWHAHECHLFKWPKSRAEFWREKIGGNRARDIRQLAALDEAGWRVLIIWECALKGKTRIDFELVVNQTSAWLTGTDRLGIISGGSVDGD